MATSSKQDSRTDPGELNNNVVNQERSANRVGSAGNLNSNTTWRLVLLSSKIRQSSVLSSATRNGVRILPYKYDNTTLESILSQAQQSLGDKKAESIALIANGQQGTLQLCATGDQVRSEKYSFSHLFYSFVIEV
jgi:hypothetical protein